MPEGSDNVKNNQNLYFLIRTANESLMAGGIKFNSFGQNLMPEGSDNVKNNQNMYFEKQLSFRIKT